VADLISSAANPVIKRMRLLSDRKHRRREGAFVVEGIQPVRQAVEAGADLEVLVVAPALLGSRTAELVAGREAAGTRVARVTGELFARLSARDGPSGLAAIVPVARAADPAEFFAWAAGAGVSVITTSARAERSFWEAGYPRPLALLLGAEGAGLPDDVLAAGDAQVRIPMTGTADSLNLAVAAGLLLYQARKPDLTGEQAAGRRSPAGS
jgi:tRNA G18 (ribose-2'-O)-methylase SpoU